jgi:hypothetical protein
MVRTLTDVPVIEAPRAVPTPRGLSIPVLDYVED